MANGWLKSGAAVLGLMPVSARWIAAGAIGLVLASGAAVAQTSAGAGAPATTPINAGPYVPTPTVIVSELLKMAEIKPGDFVIDLGSGDGRLVITAAKQGARGWGIDIQDVLVKLANENAEKEGVADRVKFVRGDLFEASVAEATVVTLYLLPTTVVKLIPKFLAELKPGTRVVSHDYPLAPWQHEKVAQFEFEEKVKISGTTRTVLYRYIIPAKLEGTWDVRLPPALAKGPARFTFTQDPTLKVRGTAFVNGRQLNFDDVTVRGEEFNARLQELAPGGDRVKLRGTVNGSTIRGSAEVDGKAQPWQATLRPR